VSLNSALPSLRSRSHPPRFAPKPCGEEDGFYWRLTGQAERAWDPVEKESFQTWQVGSFYEQGIRRGKSIDKIIHLSCCTGTWTF